MWWREGVLYQIYPRSFADGDGDGIGDLRGSRRSWTTWMARRRGIWLNPINPSPNVDWGYDVADYTGVHPDLGSLADVDRLVAEAGRRGIRVLLDLVPNHTSDQHPWFRERPDFYVWADEVPNNWQAIFGGGSAWELDERADATTCTTSRRSSRTSTGGTLTSGRSSSGSSASGSTAASPASESTSHMGSSRTASFATTVGDQRDHSMNRPETHESTVTGGDGRCV